MVIVIERVLQGLTRIINQGLRIGFGSQRCCRGLSALWRGRAGGMDASTCAYSYAAGTHAFTTFATSTTASSSTAVGGAASAAFTRSTA